MDGVFYFNLCLLNHQHHLTNETNLTHLQLSSVINILLFLRFEITTHP